MFYYMLNGELEPEVRDFARRRCQAGEYVLFRDHWGHVIAGFRDEDRATLFLNLFDGDILSTFEIDAQSAA